MSATNRAVVQRLFNDGLNNHDLSVMMELCPDCILHMPLVGDLRGEALGQFFAALLNAFPDLQRTMDGYGDGRYSKRGHSLDRHWHPSGTVHGHCSDRQAVYHHWHLLPSHF